MGWRRLAAAASAVPQLPAPRTATRRLGEVGWELWDEGPCVQILHKGPYADEPATNKALYSHPMVSCTPHIGAATNEAQKRIGAEIVDIIKAM